MARTQNHISPRIVMLWALDNMEDMTPELLANSDETYQQALEAYTKSIEGDEPKTEKGRTIKTLVASVSGHPVAALRYVSRQGRSLLKVECEEDLASDARVRKAVFASGEDVVVDDFSGADIALLSRFGSDEWKAFLAVEHPLRETASES